MTPCKPDSAPDFAALARMGKHLMLQGMSAVVYCGLMGDWPLLSAEQRMQGAEALVKAEVLWWSARGRKARRVTAHWRLTRQLRISVGLTLAALTGQLVRQLARHQATTMDISALAPERYFKNF
jgi:hypothetical protein